jgi:hypothetical protein
LATAYPEVPGQRCWAHKIRNVLNVRRRTRPMGTFQDRTSLERILFAVFMHAKRNQGLAIPIALTRNPLTLPCSEESRSRRFGPVHPASPPLMPPRPRSRRLVICISLGCGAAHARTAAGRRWPGQAGGFPRASGIVKGAALDADASSGSLESFAKCSGAYPCLGALNARGWAGEQPFRAGALAPAGPTDSQGLMDHQNRRLMKMG